MPAASGTEQASSSAEVGEAGTTSSSTTSIQRSVTASAVPAGASMAGTTTTSSTAAALPINQESITANSDIRPMFSHSTSVDQSLEPASASASAAAPKRKDEAFADLEQNLQNIMAGVSKPKTTTTPSTPTTSAAQTTFVQTGTTSASADPQMALQQQQQQQPQHHEVIPDAEQHGSRFQVSPITEERPANLAIDPKGKWQHLEIKICTFGIRFDMVF